MAALSKMLTGYLRRQVFLLLKKKRESEPSLPPEEEISETSDEEVESVMDEKSSEMMSPSITENGSYTHEEEIEPVHPSFKESSLYETNQS